MRRPRPREFAYATAAGLAVESVAALGWVWAGTCPWDYALLTFVGAGLGAHGWMFWAQEMRQHENARAALGVMRGRLVDQLMADLGDGAIKIVFCGDCPARGTAADFGRSLGEEQQ